MTGIYGPYDSRRKCWVGKAGGESHCMRPHRLESVLGGEQLFLAIASASGSSDGCHGCGGTLGLLVLNRLADGSYALAARNSLYEPFGSWGEVPTEEAFKVAQIGGQAFAWVIEAGFTAQGYTGVSQHIFAPVGAAVVDLGSIPSHHDDCGANDSCTTYDFSIRFAPGTGSTYFDAVAELVPGSTVPDFGRRAVIPFDAVTKKYVAPESYSSLMDL